jgi:hypothetical protein
LERRQAVAAFSTRYMGFRWSEVQILSPRFFIGNTVVRSPNTSEKLKVAKFDLDYAENYVIAPESNFFFMTAPEGKSELARFSKDQQMIWQRGDFNDNKVPGDT